MLTIRLTRKGKKNQPFFRVVVIDKKRSSTGGRAVEILGYVDPLTKKKSLKKDRILHWIKNGAQPSATIHNLLISEKIIVPTGIRSRILDKIGKGKKIHVARVKKSATAETTSTATAPSTSVAVAAPAVEKHAETTPLIESEKAAPSSSAKATEDKESPKPAETEKLIEAPK